MATESITKELQDTTGIAAFYNCMLLQWLRSGMSVVPNQNVPNRKQNEQATATPDAFSSVMSRHFVVR
jgi:hypothetical protein